MSSPKVSSDTSLGDARQSTLRQLLIAMITAPTILVLVRFWSRALLPPPSTPKSPPRFWWDDWTVLLALILNIAQCSTGFRFLKLGMGTHVADLPPENVEAFLKLLWIDYYIFDTAQAVAKSSALFFYTRVFGTSKAGFKYTIWAVHALNAVWLAVFIFAAIFECSPMEKFWKPSTPGTCISAGKLWVASGISSLIIDTIILLLPLPMLWQLQMKTMRKILVAGVFVCGYLVVVVSIGHAVTVIQTGSQLEEDPTYNIIKPILWLASEIGISVISVSLPSIFLLAQRAHRTGLKSLFSNRPQSTLIRSHANNRADGRTRLHEDDSTELVKPSLESLSHDSRYGPIDHSHVAASSVMV